VQGKSLVENGFGYLESFVKSETGRRLVGVIPRLVAAKNMEKMLEVRKDDVQSKLKGKTVSRDLLLLVYFMNHLLPSL
jgi:hypothetical protein